MAAMQQKNYEWYETVKIANLGEVELEGPYECPRCGGHLMVDITFLVQVSEEVTCPYCCSNLFVPLPEPRSNGSGHAG